jgi:uncharacterized protein (DUF305 family)
MRRISIALAAILLLGGCGSAPSSPTPSTTTADTSQAGRRHVPADIDFVRAMLPHHQAGIALARAVAAQPATQPAARTLAQAIIVTQQDEIVRMTGWLREWSAPGPASGAAASGAGKSGADPVRALIAHQQEAIELAQQEQASGSNPAALAFARQVIESRTAEIDQLRGPPS